jgi:hypothetical protein
MLYPSERKKLVIVVPVGHKLAGHVASAFRAVRVGGPD